MCVIENKFTMIFMFQKKSKQWKTFKFKCPKNHINTDRNKILSFHEAKFHSDGEILVGGIKLRRSSNSRFTNSFVAMFSPR